MMDESFLSLFEERVTYWRRTPIRGQCVDLIPYTSDHAMDVVTLRNRPEARYFLNQSQNSTLAMQQEWHQAYFERNNDVFWVLCNKKSEIVGCNRLYDMHPNYAEKGSLILDVSRCMSAPIALESDLLVIDLAFEIFQFKRIITSVREDNGKVVSMNERMGFKKQSRKTINGVSYWLLALASQDFNADYMRKIVNYWGMRNEFGKT